jgi:hypothetical protein
VVYVHGVVLSAICAAQAVLQTLPRDAELLAFEAGGEDYCEREVDEVE